MYFVLYHKRDIDLIGIPPSDNNGTEGSLHHILKDPPTLVPSSPSTYTDCLYPENDADYMRRADLSTAMCQCTPPTVSAHHILYHLG